MVKDAIRGGHSEFTLPFVLRSLVARTGEQPRSTQIEYGVTYQPHQGFAMPFTWTVLAA
jgi:hypothetical protein